MFLKVKDTSFVGWVLGSQRLGKTPSILGKHNGTSSECMSDPTNIVRIGLWVFQSRRIHGGILENSECPGHRNSLLTVFNDIESFKDF